MPKHFLSIKELSKEAILEILNIAMAFQQGYLRDTLQRKWVANLFFEPSTRTRCSFEMAAKQLGAQVLSLDINYSSIQKGEIVFDTAKTLEAMGCHFLVVRHVLEGMSQQIAEVLQTASVINAGDGQNEHPTQAILDMLTIQQYKPCFSELCVAIVGDILHSRVARSNILALQTLEVKNIRIIAPLALLPLYLHELKVQVFENLYEGLVGVDVIIVLRVQKERMHHEGLIDMSTFSQSYCVTEKALAVAKPDAIVMHPGPVNRGIEITSAVVDGPQSVILRQVTNGVAARMAIFKFLMELSGLSAANA